MSARVEAIYNLLLDPSRGREVAELGVALTDLRKLAFQGILPLNMQEEDHRTLHEILRLVRVVVQKLYIDNPDEADALINSLPLTPTDSLPLLDQPPPRAAQDLDQSPIRQLPESIVQSPDSALKLLQAPPVPSAWTITRQTPRSTPIPNTRVGSPPVSPPLSPRRQKSPPGNPFDDNF